MHAFLLTALLAAAPEALTFPDAVSRALRFEPSVEVQQLEQERARLALLRAQLDRFSLTVDGQLQEVVTRTGGDSPFVGLSYGRARLDVPVFAGFRIQSQVERTRALEAASTSTLEELQQQTARAVARAFFGVLRLDAASEAQREALGRLEQAARIAAVRVKSGLAAPVDENRARAQWAGQRAELARLEGQLQGARAELAVLLGLPSLPPLTAPARATLSLAEAQPWLDRALTQRPLLSSLSRTVEAEEASALIARSGYFPQLALHGLVEAGNAVQSPLVFPGLPTSPSPFADGRLHAQAGVTLSLNLFDTLKTYTAHRDARLRAQAAKARLREGRQEVERDVRVAHARTAELASLSEPLGEAHRLSADTVDILRKRYEQGDALMLELLDAELVLLRNERELAEVEVSLQLAWVELRAASGELVEDIR